MSDKNDGKSNGVVGKKDTEEKFAIIDLGKTDEDDEITEVPDLNPDESAESVEKALPGKYPAGKIISEKLPESLFPTADTYLSDASMGSTRIFTLQVEPPSIAQVAKILQSALKINDFEIAEKLAKDAIDNKKMIIIKPGDTFRVDRKKCFFVVKGKLSMSTKRELFCANSRSVIFTQGDFVILPVDVNDKYPDDHVKFNAGDTGLVLLEFSADSMANFLKVKGDCFSALIINLDRFFNNGFVVESSSRLDPKYEYLQKIETLEVDLDKIRKENAELVKNLTLERNNNRDLRISLKSSTSVDLDSYTNKIAQLEKENYLLKNAYFLLKKKYETIIEASRDSAKKISGAFKAISEMCSK